MFSIIWSDPAAAEYLLIAAAIVAGLDAVLLALRGGLLEAALLPAALCLVAVALLAF